jgi:hypothetical protein
MADEDDVVAAVMPVLVCGTRNARRRSTPARRTGRLIPVTVGEFAASNPATAPSRVILNWSVRGSLAKPRVKRVGLTAMAPSALPANSYYRKASRPPLAIRRARHIKLIEPTMSVFFTGGTAGSWVEPSES